ncbi:PIN domain-containing protein [Patescibacteria group bacterium]|nr:PIN domain-containing protein [Patescibacteria group bacterium]MBU4016700.1 PIN domain-containing protein [Patescibacteria group bacterium]
MYLPDTNIFINFFKRSERELNLMQRLIIQNSLVLSVVVIGEIYAKADDREKRIFDKFLLRFHILDIDVKTAKIAGEYRKKFLRTNRTILLDCFLAAQAKVHSLTLVTNNKADFPMKDIKIISP